MVSYLSMLLQQTERIIFYRHIRCIWDSLPLLTMPVCSRNGVPSRDGVRSSNGIRSRDGVRSCDGVRSPDDVRSCDGVRSRDDVRSRDGIRSCDGVRSRDDVRSRDSVHSPDGVRSCDGAWNFLSASDPNHSIPSTFFSGVSHVITWPMYELGIEPRWPGLKLNALTTHWYWCQTADLIIRVLVHHALSAYWRTMLRQNTLFLSLELSPYITVVVGRRQLLTKLGLEWEHKLKGGAKGLAAWNQHEPNVL